MAFSSAVPGSIWLEPSLAPGPNPDVVASDPDPLESTQVKPHTQTKSNTTAPPTGVTASSILLQVPTPRETFDKLYEAKAPPPLFVPSHPLLCSAGPIGKNHRSRRTHSLLSTSPSEIPLPPTPPSESDSDSDSDVPASTVLQKLSQQKGNDATSQGSGAEDSQAKTNSRLSSVIEVNEPETSESQYSMESALNFNDVPPQPESSATSDSTSRPSLSEENAGCSAGCEGEKSPEKSPRTSRPDISEDGRAARSSADSKKERSFLRQLSPKKSIKNALAMGRRLGIRGRLRSLRE